MDLGLVKSTVNLFHCCLTIVTLSHRALPDYCHLRPLLNVITVPPAVNYFPVLLSGPLFYNLICDLMGGWLSFSDAELFDLGLI